MLNRIPIKPGDHVLDIGANVGTMSQYFLDRGAQVLAFEPNPHARKVLKAKLHTHSDLTISEAAVGISSGKRCSRLSEQRYPVL